MVEYERIIRNAQILPARSVLNTNNNRGVIHNGHFISGTITRVIDPNPTFDNWNQVIQTLFNISNGSYFIEYELDFTFINEDGYALPATEVTVSSASFVPDEIFITDNDGRIQLSVISGRIQGADDDTSVSDIEFFFNAYGLEQSIHTVDISNLSNLVNDDELITVDNGLRRRSDADARNVHRFEYDVDSNTITIHSFSDNPSDSVGFSSDIRDLYDWFKLISIHNNDFRDIVSYNEERGYVELAAGVNLVLDASDNVETRALLTENVSPTPLRVNRGTVSSISDDFVFRTGQLAINELPISGDWIVGDEIVEAITFSTCVTYKGFCVSKLALAAETVAGLDQTTQLLYISGVTATTFTMYLITSSSAANSNAQMDYCGWNTEVQRYTLNDQTNIYDDDNNFLPITAPNLPAIPGFEEATEELIRRIYDEDDFFEGTWTYSVTGTGEDSEINLTIDDGLTVDVINILWYLQAQQIGNPGNFVGTTTTDNELFLGDNNYVNNTINYDTRHSYDGLTLTAPLNLTITGDTRIVSSRILDILSFTNSGADFPDETQVEIIINGSVVREFTALVPRLTLARARSVLGGF